MGIWAKKSSWEWGVGGSLHNSYNPVLQDSTTTSPEFLLIGNMTHDPANCPLHTKETDKPS